MGRAGIKAVAARAHDAHFVVSGMDSCLHDLLNLNANHLILKDGQRIRQTVEGRIGKICFFQMLSRSLVPYFAKHGAKHFEATTVEASKAGYDPEVAKT